MLEVTAAIIRRGQEFLICQRPAGKNCEYLWEFPGGKIEPAETGEICIIRECREELGVTIQVLEKVSEVIYDYPDRSVHLHFYLAEIAEGTLTRKEHNALAWIRPEDIPSYRFCPADEKMLQQENDLRSILR